MGIIDLFYYFEIIHDNFVGLLLLSSQACYNFKALLHNSTDLLTYETNNLVAILFFKLNFSSTYYDDHFYRTKFNRLYLYCLFYKTVSFKKIEGKLVFNMLEVKQKAVGICQGSAAVAVFNAIFSQQKAALKKINNMHLRR